VRDAVLLNAAAALVAAGVGTGTLEERMRAGLREAATSVDSGAAARVLERWVAASRSGPHPR
jgi:anthranilate phosphoribosyltransferase